MDGVMMRGDLISAVEPRRRSSVTSHVLPYFSIDHIAQVIVPYIPEQDYAVRQVLLTKLGVR